MRCRELRVHTLAQAWVQEYRCESFLTEKYAELMDFRLGSRGGGGRCRSGPGLPRRVRRGPRRGRRAVPCTFASFAALVFWRRV